MVNYKIILLGIGIAFFILFISSTKMDAAMFIGECGQYKELIDTTNTNIVICKQNYNDKVTGQFSPIYRTTILNGLSEYDDETIKYTIIHENCHAKQLNRMGFFTFSYNAIFNREMMELECK